MPKALPSPRNTHVFSLINTADSRVNFGNLNTRQSSAGRPLPAPPTSSPFTCTILTPISTTVIPHLCYYSISPLSPRFPLPISQAQTPPLPSPPYHYVSY